MTDPEIPVEERDEQNGDPEDVAINLKLADRRLPPTQPAGPDELPPSKPA